VLSLLPYHHCSELVEMVVVEVLVVIHLVVVEGVVVLEMLLMSAARAWLVGIVVEVPLGIPPPWLVFYLSS